MVSLRGTRSEVHNPPNVSSPPPTAVAQDPEAVFRRFVHNANEVGRYAQTLRVPLDEILGQDEPLPLVRRITALPLQRRKVPATQRSRPSLDDLRTSEGTEDGMAPPRLLERVLENVEVALRFGHRSDVYVLLGALQERYPGDLLLLRRIAEMYEEQGDLKEATQTLVRLAGALVERGQLEAARSVVERARRLGPADRRLARLESLLAEKRQRG